VLAQYLCPAFHYAEDVSQMALKNIWRCPLMKKFTWGSGPLLHMARVLIPLKKL